MRLYVTLALIIAFSSCTKKREESFVQGHGRDLLVIENFEGKEFEVETLELIGNQSEMPKISKAEEVLTSKNKTIGTFGLVEIKTAAELVKDVPFVAIPKKQKTYSVRYSLDQNNLIVLKVASKEFLHASELAGATAEKDGRFSVPLVGYPIKGYYNVENVLQNREKSSSIIESAARDKSSAKYFKIDLNGRTLYKLQEKQDVIPKEYFGFEGKSVWYAAFTVVGAGFDSYNMYSEMLAQKDGMGNDLTKIRFSESEKQIQIINAVRDSRIDQKDNLNHQVLLSIPTEWKDYQPSKVGAASIAMSEEENTKLDWKSKRFAKLDFAGAFQGSQFVDLEIEEDYFSFTINSQENGMRLKASFLRAKPRDYKKKQMFDSDFEKFGFFSTQREEFSAGMKYRKEDFGKNIFINRFNPKSSEIVFHVTHGTDQKYLSMIQRAADAWTLAFDRAGLKTKITIGKDLVKLGDLRYNQINLIKPGLPIGLGGYGPSIADSETGEIIMATSNIDARGYTQGMAYHIREYILDRADLLKGASVLVGMPQVLNDVQVQNEKAYIQVQPGERNFLKFFPEVQGGQLAKRQIVSRLQEESTRKSEGNTAKVATQSKKDHYHFGSKCDTSSVSTKNMNAKIEANCKFLAPVIEAIKNDRQHENEAALVMKCAEEIAPEYIYGVLLHEMGHNFGLRHNFAASSDPINFWKKEELGDQHPVVESSSVMEYPASNEDRPTLLGRYDIAAIRFGYGNAVELKDGSIVGLGPDKCENGSCEPTQSIDEKFGLIDAKSGLQKESPLRRFRFCTDHDVYAGGDPMCDRFDHGRNPFEKAQYLVSEYNSSIEHLNYKRFRPEGHYTNNLTRMRLRWYWIPLKKMYDEWRYKLSDQLGVGYEYLENVDAKKIERVIESMKAKCNRQVDESSEACLFVDYKKAADVIFEFALRIATLPPRLCIGERNGKIAMTEFSDVRQFIIAQKKIVPQSCMDEAAVAYIKENLDFTPLQEGGFELEDVRYDSKVRMSKTKTDWWGNPLPVGPDVNGLMPEKAIAMQVLSARASLSMSADEKKFLPNFLDEPQYRDRVLTYIADRITKGIPSSEILKGDLLAKYKDVTHLERFKTEKQYIESMVWDVFSGLGVPGKEQSTRSRKRKFLVRYTNDYQTLNRAKFTMPALDGTYSYAIMNNDATEAKKLLQMLETLPKRLTEASPLNDETFVKVFEFAEQYLSDNDSSIDAPRFVEFIYNLIEDEFPEANGTRTQDQRAIDKYRAHWKNVFAAEVGFVRKICGEIMAPGGGGPSNCMGGAMILAGDIDKYKKPGSKEFSADLLKQHEDLAKLIFSNGYTLNKKTVKERINAYFPVASEKLKNSDNTDVFNYEELSTQMDLIMGVLRSIMDY